MKRENRGGWGVEGRGGGWEKGEVVGVMTSEFRGLPPPTRCVRECRTVPASPGGPRCDRGYLTPLD